MVGSEQLTTWLEANRTAANMAGIEQLPTWLEANS
jgi:hypothetical protein